MNYASESLRRRIVDNHALSYHDRLCDQVRRTFHDSGIDFNQQRNADSTSFFTENIQGGAAVFGKVKDIVPDVRGESTQKYGTRMIYCITIPIHCRVQKGGCVRYIAFVSFLMCLAILIWTDLYQRIL